MQNKKKKKIQYYDEYGQPVDKYGRPVDRNGIAYADYDKNGNPPKPQKQIKRKKKRHKLSVVRMIVIVFAVVVGLIIADGAYLLSIYDYDDTDESSLSGHTAENGIMTIALFGVDTRENGDSGTRSDAIMIMSVDPSRSSIKLISLMRDSYVNVPDHGMTKICHAYGYGGPQLVMETINKNFDMDITEYMVVDFAQMAAIIDSVGGVTVNLTEDELLETNKYINEYCWENGIGNQPIQGSGEQKLNGIQAMTYGRIRKGNTGGDWQRTQRQSEVLNQVFSKAAGNPITLLRFLHGLMPNIKSSMSKTDFCYMGLHTVIHGIPSMDHLRLPLDNEWSYGTTDSGMSVVQFSDNVLTKRLHQYIFDDIKPEE